MIDTFGCEVPCPECGSRVVSMIPPGALEHRPGCENSHDESDAPYRPAVHPDGCECDGCLDNHVGLIVRRNLRAAIREAVSRHCELGHSGQVVWESATKTIEFYFDDAACGQRDESWDAAHEAAVAYARGVVAGVAIAREAGRVEA